MRRFSIGLVLVVALLLMLTAIAASAVPDGFCDDGRVHPQCPTTTTPTPTTIPEYPAPEPCPSGIFEVPSVPGWTTFGCDWILPKDAPDVVAGGDITGVITVDLLKGEVGSLTVTVRDSSPGDICELTWDGKALEEDWEWYLGPLPDDGLVLTVPLQDDRGTYWDFAYYDDKGASQPSSGEHWCEWYDPIEGLRTELNGDPLHLQLTMRAAKGTVVEVTLSPVLIQEEERS